MLFIYLNFIKEDWDVYKKWAIPFIKTLWFMRSILIWFLSVIFFPFFFFGMKFEKEIKDGIKRFLIKNI